MFDFPSHNCNVYINIEHQSIYNLVIVNTKFIQNITHVFSAAEFHLHVMNKYRNDANSFSREK
jgi:hypothetical protein